MATKSKRRTARKKKKAKPKPKPQETATTKYVGFRLPHRTLAAIEQYRGWLSEDFGLSVNRTTALVHLVGRCWEQIKFERQRAEKPTVRRPGDQKD